MRPSSETLAIWVYAHSPPEHVFTDDRPRLATTGLEMYRTPYHGNLNAQSQRGTFMYVRATSVSASEGMEQFEERRWEELGIAGDQPFTKLVLPTARAPQLLSELGRLGVSATSLFPGYVGASRAAAVKSYDLRTRDQHEEEINQWNGEVQTKYELLASMIKAGQIVVSQ